MIRRMLINTRHPEEYRVAIADDDQLVELEIERADLAQLRGNIYKAAITRIEPSLQAAFLDIGSNRNGFLQINDVHSAYFHNWPPEQTGRRSNRPSIQDVLKPGQELVVQVVKDERDAKGATLTTNISIPGRYLVLMIGNQRGGVSRKINDEGQRIRLKQILQGLKMPAGMGVIVRTAGINKSLVELQADLDALIEQYFDAVQTSLEPGSPKVLYKEADLPIRYIRDYLTPDIDEILVDAPDVYQRAKEFLDRVVPGFSDKLVLYDKKLPLFSAFHLDSQVDGISHSEVTLPSGGSMVFAVTEAVVTVDVNSGRSTSQADVEHTAFRTNLEAASAIATQLKLRDLGGLIVIDFIDMADKRHKASVEKAIKDAVRSDKAKVEIGRISKFGLLEMSRQRLKTSIVNQSQMICHHCQGRGRVKTPESAALDVLRKIETAVYSGGVNELRVRMSPSPALLLLNDKRNMLSELERETNCRIIIFADGRMRPEEYELEIVGTRRMEERSESHRESREPREESRSRGRRRKRSGGRKRPASTEATVEESKEVTEPEELKVQALE
jgi:ribonuclease E